ncbi:MAG: 50S ribosomal protein L7ae [Erysipelotrichaceae bacterium]|nr:50S ribosomal protein L7ae [Erysipelotrichaceae bacterium]
MDNVLSLLGLAYRANKLMFGETCLDNMQKVKFLFIALDASDKTKERYLRKCEYFKIPYTLKYSCEQLSTTLGKNTVKIVGITDKGFKDSLIKKLEAKEGLNG